MAFDLSSYVGSILGLPNNTSEYNPGINAPSNYNPPPPEQDTQMMPAPRPNYPSLIPPPARGNMFATGPLPGEDASSVPGAMAPAPRPNFPVTPPPSQSAGYPFMRPYPGDESNESPFFTAPGRPPDMPRTSGVPYANLGGLPGGEGAPAPNMGMGPARMPPPQAFPNPMSQPPQERMPVSLAPPGQNPNSVLGGPGNMYRGATGPIGGWMGEKMGFNPRDTSNFMSRLGGGLASIKPIGKFGSAAHGAGAAMGTGDKEGHVGDQERREDVKLGQARELLDAKLPLMRAQAQRAQAMGDWYNSGNGNNPGPLGISQSSWNTPFGQRHRTDLRIDNYFKEERTAIAKDPQLTDAQRQEKFKALDAKVEQARSNEYKKQGIPEKHNFGEGNEKSPYNLQNMGIRTEQQLNELLPPGSVYTNGKTHPDGSPQLFRVKPKPIPDLPQPKASPPPFTQADSNAEAESLAS